MNEAGMAGGPAGGRRPTVMAVFSWRHDAHLVPDLLENVAPIVDGWVAFDDTASGEFFSEEPTRRQALIARARELGANWVLAMDPDERLEIGAADRIRTLTRSIDRIIWRFDLREMFTSDSYRVDGVWGRKQQDRLFPLLPGQQFSDRPYHGQWRPIEGGYRFEHSGLNIYHLKMIDPARRQARSDLYKTLDPQGAFQKIGYDYLADETGMILERIEPGREFTPPHRDDGGLWMADPRGLASA